MEGTHRVFGQPQHLVVMTRVLEAAEATPAVCGGGEGRHRLEAIQAESGAGEVPMLSRSFHPRSRVSGVAVRCLSYQLRGTSKEVNLRRYYPFPLLLYTLDP